MEDNNNIIYEANGYAIIPHDVLYDRTLQDSERVMYAVVNGLTRARGYCWASNNALATMVGCSKSAVSKRLAALERAGYIHTETIQQGRKIAERRIYTLVHAGKAVGSCEGMVPAVTGVGSCGARGWFPQCSDNNINNNINNTYTTSSDEDCVCSGGAEDRPPVVNDKGHDTGSGQVSTSVAGDDGSRRRAPKRPDPVKDTGTDECPHTIDYDLEFEAIWQAYPSEARSGRKAKCRERYVKARRSGTTEETIRDGLDRYIRYVQARRQGGFDLHYKNAETWFNGRWDDVYPTDTLPEPAPQETFKPAPAPRMETDAVTLDTLNDLNLA